MYKKLPRWVFRFLELTCSSAYLDELEGDLLELFERDLQHLSLAQARRNFIWKALLSVRWYRLPGLGDFQFFNMWNNHFKMAYRHALRHKSVSFVNFAGLLLGIAAAFYIGLFLKNELAFDSMHQHGAELYRVLPTNQESGKRIVSTSSRHGKSLSEAFPFASVCRFGNDPVKIGDRQPLLIQDFYWSDSTFFDLFSFPLLHGDPHTCLDEVNSLVITASLSKQLFGTEATLGKIVKVKVYDGDAEFQMKITGIAADLPRHSHIQFQALGAMANAEKLYANLITSWGFSWLRTYVKVPEGRMAEVKAGIPDLMAKHLGADAEKLSMEFQPFEEVYLGSQDIYRNDLKGDYKTLYIFGAIGLLILLISVSNYINLATARAVTRSKEVGIRKVLGTSKSGILAQFIAEAVFFTLIAGAIAIGGMMMALPALNRFLELPLSAEILHWQDWLQMLLGLLALGIIAGILPAWSMAKLGFLNGAKTSISFRKGQGALTRKMFIGVQYLVTLVLLVATFVIYQQYDFMKNYDLGFDSEQMLHLAVDDRQLQERLPLLKEKIAALPGVHGITATGEDMPSMLNNTWGMKWTGEGKEKTSPINIISVDRDYFATMDIALKAGRNFTQDFAVDSARSVIFNEQAARLLEPAKVIGEAVNIGQQMREVIGVVEDHHNTTLYAPPNPTAYFIFPAGMRVSPDNLFLKIDPTNIPALLSAVEGIWKQFSSDPFKYNFVDEAFAEAYQQERKFSRLLSSFTLIAILISLIGLFGLISFTTQLKGKEISIRRVLGATEFHLLQILGKEFMAVFILALFIALPAAFYLMQAWLANYPYHISMSIWFFVLSAVICLSISVLVIAYHLQRTARQNMGEALAAE